MFYYVSRIILVIVLILVAAILHQSTINARNQVTPDVTEQVDVQKLGDY